jgi:hypothetical protein
MHTQSVRYMRTILLPGAAMLTVCFSPLQTHAAGPTRHTKAADDTGAAFRLQLLEPFW